MPMINTMIGGIFSACGTTRANATGIIHGDAWAESENQLVPYNGADTAGDANCWCWFNSTFVRGGAFTIGGNNYGLARWDFGTSEWIGMGSINGAQVIAMFVFKGFCYISFDAGPSERVQRIDPADWSIDSISFAANVGSGFCRAMLDFDFAGTIKLVFVGAGFNAGGGNQYVRCYDGSSYSDIGGPIAGSSVVRGICRHDFTEEQDGEDMLCIGGKFDQIGATTGYVNVAYYKASDTSWNKIGAGVSLVGTTGGEVSCLASYNGRLWAGRENPNATRTALAAIANSGGDWQEAANVLTNLDVGESGPLWQYDGTSPASASVLTMDVYAGRLHVGGWFQFRGSRRGASATGAVTFWEGRSNNLIYRALPFIKGSVSALCEYDGELVFGGDCRYLIGTATHRYLGSWAAPVNPEDEGTLSSFGGGVNGPVYAACEFDGKLFVCGDFTEAGGVTAKGIAYWNGTSWAAVVNIRDYGIPRKMVVFGSELIVAGDFAKVDGSATYKLAVRLTTTFTKGALFDDLTGPQGNGIIRALHVSADGMRLYMGGEFDELDQLGAFGVMNPSNIAYTTGVASTWLWFTLADMTLEGISGGTVHSIGEKEVSGVDWIFVGCDPTAKGGDNGTADPLWRWDPVLLNWVNGESALIGVNQPIQAMANTSDQQTLNFSHYGTAGDTGGNQYKIRDHTVGQSNIWLGEGTGGQAYSAQPKCMVWADAGDGTKLYIGNEKGSLGNLAEESSAPAMLILAINQDDEVVDVAGGCGTAAFFDFFVQDQYVKHLREDVTSDTRDEVQTAAVAGTPDGTGKLTATVIDHKGKEVETADIDDNATWATALANIQAGLDAVLGVNRVIAGGASWGALTFTYSGIGYTRHNRPMIRLNIDKTKINISGTPTAGTFTITIKRTGQPDVTTAAIAWADTMPVVVANINAALEAAVGSYVTAEGEGWDALYLLHADVNHDVPTVDISSLTGATDVDVETTRLTGATAVTVTRTTRVENQRLLVAGIFGNTSRRYATLLCGIDIAGRMVPVAEGLSGVYDPASLVQRYPFEIKAIPRASWPAEWTSDADSDLSAECQPHYKHVWLIAGNFRSGVNGDWVRTEDAHISDIVSVPGIAIYDGVRYFRNVGLEVGPQTQPETADCFGGDLVSGGGGPLEYYDYADDTWKFFIEPTDTGAMGTDSLIRKMVVAGSVLICGGQMTITGTGYRSIVLWNGTAFTGVDPPDFTDDPSYIRDIVYGNIGGGAKHYAGGFPNTDKCPVVESSNNGTSWSAVGGASQLRGECYSLAVIEVGTTKFLFATGALSIDVGGGFEDVQTAWWNGTAWAIGPYFNTLAGPSEKCAVGDFHGRQSCEVQFARVLFGGDFIEVGAAGELGTTDASYAAGMATFKHSDYGAAEGLDLGGMNGRATAIGSAGEHLWG